MTRLQLSGSWVDVLVDGGIALFENLEMESREPTSPEPSTRVTAQFEKRKTL
jgi:hypothetical protein